MRTTKTITLWLAVCLALVLSISVQGQDVNDVNIPEFNNGITFSTLFQEDSSDSAAAWGRLGYQYGSLEAFIGLDSDGKSFEYGVKMYSRDIAAQGAVKYLSDFMVMYFNTETLDVRGYSGFHRVEGEGTKDYSGGLLGLEQKERGSPLALTAEVQFNDENRIVYLFGLKLGF